MTPLALLAPDQRAALELVLRQGRSYGELSDLLGMPEETIRNRARGGVAALAPDLPAPNWAALVASGLRMLPGGESVPELPSKPDEAPRRVNGTARAAATSGAA